MGLLVVKQSVLLEMYCLIAKMITLSMGHILIYHEMFEILWGRRLNNITERKRRHLDPAYDWEKEDLEVQANNDGNVRVNMAVTMRMRVNMIFDSDIDNCFVMAINERCSIESIQHSHLFRCWLSFK